MALVRFQPARELDTLHNEMNRLLGGFFGDLPGTSTTQRWIPAMDLYEEGDEYVLECDLPGMSDEDIDVEYQDDVLTISGEREWKHEREGDGLQRRERAYGSFTRALSLPGIDPDSIKASFDQGVLQLRVPKPAERQARRIQIGREQQTIEGESRR